MLIIRDVFNDQNHLEEAKSRFIQALPFLAAALLTASAATLYAKAFQLVETRSMAIIHSIGYASLIWTPVLFILSWALVEYWGREANGSGIPQLMASAELSSHDSSNPVIHKLLGVRVILVKVVSSLLGVMGGGAIGREGPTLQISGSIFHLVGKFINKGRHSANHHILILAGGAAGLASAFNTPLGGIAYAMEELSKSHLASFRTGVLQAVIVAGFCAQLILGPYLYLGYPKTEPVHFSEFGQLVFTAVMAALVVSFFSQGLKLVVIYRSQLTSKRTKLFIAALAGFLFAAIGISLGPSAYGSGKEMLAQLLFNGKTAGLAEFMGRFFGSIFSYAAGGAGGIFAPTLALGAVTSSLAQGIFESPLGAIGILGGMTAGLAAFTQSPFTSFVLILEMTDRHSAIFPLMVAALIGQGVSKSVSKVSFYEFICRRILASQQPPARDEVKVPAASEVNDSSPSQVPPGH